MSDDTPNSPEEIAEEARQKISETSNEFEARMAELEKRGAAAKARYEATKTKVATERKESGDSARGLGIGLAVAYAIIGAPLAGFGAGFLIDKANGGDTWKGILGLIGSVAGVAYAILILNREEKKRS